MKIRTLTGTEFRRRMGEGLEVPDRFSFSVVIEELRKIYPPRHRQGFTVFFMALSGAGMSTIASALPVKMAENGSRKVTLLDGDIVRKHLSSELTFSKEHRDLNIVRIGLVAAEVTKNGGVAICAPIPPLSPDQTAGPRDGFPRRGIRRDPRGDAPGGVRGPGS